MEDAGKQRLEVHDVVKTYRQGVAAYGTFRDSLHVLLLHRRRTVRRKAALAGVSLRVAAGETLGVIGVNGAGKSTLLKVIARITPPDEGRIVVRGRLSALIEVGAGFHPELTGRENVMLHGSILGLERRLLRRGMHSIAEFAGLSDSMDIPVKQFSTGMYARLGFAVAVFDDPRVLLVDEVLSVGDEAFRQRCYDRIRELMAQGTAILFVSHDLPAVDRIAGRAVWLDEGRIRQQGAAPDITHAYRAWLGASSR